MENPYASVYGLTGIMGSGKSAAANFFREQGAVVFDADEIARSVIDPRSAWYTQLKAKLVAAFSVFTQEPLFDSAGELNRALLAQLTFGHDERVRLLNSIMHPVIQREFANRLLAVRDPEEKVIIYDVPLLFETGLEKKLKATIVVYAPEEVCIARVLARAAERGEKITAEEIRQRLRSQISIEKKRELADYIINNTGSLDDLRAEVSQLYQKLRGL
ncbi:MAG: dephospho-CoA kinase [Leptospiraceae bacterium]|nr:dephospho-CoA kinase [Leptospiraceae bacterium]